VICALFLRDRPSDIGTRPLGADLETPPPAPVIGPLQWRNVYRSSRVWHLGLVYIAFGFAYIIYVTFFIKYLITEGGYTPTGAGSLFMVVGWASLFCGLIWGPVSDIIGRKLALVFIYLMHAVSFSLFALWPEPAGFIISAILFGLSAWSMPAVMAAACGDLLGPRLAAAGLGFVTLFFGIGQAVGPSAAGAIADATGSLAPALLLAGGVSLLGAVGALMIRPIGRVSADAPDL
jgi:predicted MFS family arabinose efflux permease